MNDLPAPTSRARHGRWLGGVCAGLAARWDVPPARVRLAFVLGALALGLGVLVYLAAWLILPVANEDGTSSGPARHRPAGPGLRGAARPRDAGRGRRAPRPLFGFGWVVVALAAAVLVGTLAGWARLGPAWALLPIGALVLPSVALAVGGLRVEPSSTSVVLTPRTLAELPRDRLTSGLGLLTLDLRRTALPERRADSAADRGGRAAHADRAPARPLRARRRQAARGPGGAARRRRVRWARPSSATPETRVFGRLGERRRHRAAPAARRSRSTSRRWAASWSCATIRTTSTRPTSRTGRATRSSSRSGRTPPGSRARRPSGWLRDWRARRKAQERDKRRIDKLMGGPCTKKR